jgi:hypothetical protein
MGATTTLGSLAGAIATLSAFQLVLSALNGASARGRVLIFASAAGLLALWWLHASEPTATHYKILFLRVA